MTDFRIFNSNIEIIPTGNSLYVSVLGNNSNSGTLNQPLSTVEEALRRVGNGTVIFVGPGTYENSIPWSTTTADASCSLVFEAGAILTNDDEDMGVTLPSGASLSIYGRGTFITTNGTAMRVNNDAELFVYGAQKFQSTGGNGINKPTILTDVDEITCTGNNSAIYYGDNSMPGANRSAFIKDIRLIQSGGDTVRVTVDNDFTFRMQDIARIVNTGTEQAIAFVASPADAQTTVGEFINCHVRAETTTNAVNVAGSPEDNATIYMYNCTIKGGTRPVYVLTGKNAFVYDSVLVGGSDTIAGGGSYGFSNVTSNQTALVGPEQATELFSNNFYTNADVDVV